MQRLPSRGKPLFWRKTVRDAVFFPHLAGHPRISNHLLGRGRASAKAPFGEVFWIEASHAHAQGRSAAVAGRTARYEDRLHVHAGATSLVATKNLTIRTTIEDALRWTNRVQLARLTGTATFTASLVDPLPLFAALTLRATLLAGLGSHLSIRAKRGRLARGVLALVRGALIAAPSRSSATGVCWAGRTHALGVGAARVLSGASPVVLTSAFEHRVDELKYSGITSRTGEAKHKTRQKHRARRRSAQRMGTQDTMKSHCVGRITQMGGPPTRSRWPFDRSPCAEVPSALAGPARDES